MKNYGKALITGLDISKDTPSEATSDFLCGSGGAVLGITIASILNIPDSTLPYFALGGVTVLGLINRTKIGLKRLNI